MIQRQPTGHLRALTEEREGGALTEDLRYLMRNPTKALTKVGQMAYGVTLPISGLLNIADLAKGIASDVTSIGESLPEIEPELNLFVSQAEDTTNPNHRRNQQILTRLSDLVRRYITLNETPAQEAFNRIIHVTAINVVRDPQEASSHLAKAELDLGKLNRRFRSSPGSKEYEDYKKADDIYRKQLRGNGGYSEEYPEGVDRRLVGVEDSPSYAQMFLGTYLKSFKDSYSVVPKPAITEIYRKAQALPSQRLLETPIYQDFAPGYYKQEVAPTPTWVRPQPVPERLRRVNRKRRPERRRRGNFGRIYIDDSTGQY